MNQDLHERAILTIDEQAIASNTALLARAAGGDVMAVVKADGFGHGMLTVAKTALNHGARSIGTTGIADSIRLRRAGVRAPILSWLNPVTANFADAISHNISLAVPSEEHLEAVLRASVATGKAATIHFQIDLGMHREGLSPRRFEELIGRLVRDPRAGRVQAIGLMGHLGWAETPEDTLNERGRQTFDSAWQQARAVGFQISLRHLGGTAAALTDARNHYDFSRIGAGLVGIDPSGTTKLQTAMTLTAPVVESKTVRAGEYIGYGRHHLAERDAQLALLPLGYADGIPRIASGSGQVRLAGKNRPIVGLVNMDQVVIDTGGDRVLPGEVATIFGNGIAGEPTVADWARWSRTLPHEIVTGIGSRVHRVSRSLAVAR